MGVTTKKCGVLVSFCSKLAIFAKTVGHNLWILGKNWKFLKTGKNLYTGPLCITDPKYGGHDQEIRSFGQFLPQTSGFC
jgi:hypothetical protein